MHSARWASETWRTACIFGAVSLGVDALTIIVIAHETVRRCEDGYSTLSSTLFNNSIGAAFAACVALACVMRFQRRSPSSRQRVRLAYGVIGVAFLATLVASWVILRQHPELGCLD
jgi:putative exporter of polyketide antibiotics